jgi:hypothetical protein
MSKLYIFICMFAVLGIELVSCISSIKSSTTELQPQSRYTPSSEINRDDHDIQNSLLRLIIAGVLT